MGAAMGRYGAARTALNILEATPLTGTRMSDLHWAVISEKMRSVMLEFSLSEVGKRFYLAGGTALALQLGHRKSVDLDFFSKTEDIPAIRATLTQALNKFTPIIADASWGNLIYIAKGIQVGFFGYGYPMIDDFIIADATSLASIADIGLMKLDALLGRASRKDFHDLYEICQHVTLRHLLDYAPEKYSNVRDFESQVLRRLVFFERADIEEPVRMLEPVSWDSVKNYFRKQAIAIGSSWIE